MSPVDYTYRIKFIDRENVTVEKSGPDREFPQREMSYGTIGGHFRDDCAQEATKLHHYLSALVDSPEASQTIEQLGRRLFDALFDERLQYDFLSIYQQSTDADCLLHIELVVDEQKYPDIAALPWEFTHLDKESGKGNLWLGADPNLTFSRMREFWSYARPIDIPPGEILKIALVVATPSDLGPVDYQVIEQELQALERGQPDRFKVVEVVGPVTMDSIDKVLEKEKPHLFHFIGHGEFTDEAGKAGKIALVGAAGRAEWLNADDFSNLFTRHQPGIVVLQACEGAMASETGAFLSVASNIVQQRIPVVIAMQYAISNGAASAFARTFYHRLAAQEPVNKAVQEGRLAITRTPRHYDLRDFATPVLFTRVRESHLFTLPQPAIPQTGAISEFNTRCETTCKQIAMLAKYKKIHDLLQDIQQKYHNMDNDRARLGDDVAAWGRLCESEIDLSAALDETLDCLTEAERTELISKNSDLTRLLNEAQQEIQSAFNESDPALQEVGQREKHLNDGMRKLQRAMSYALKYNQMIVTTARVLRLEEMVDAINMVGGALQDHHKGLALQKSAKELALLVKDLRSLIDRHDRLQAIEDEFHRIDPMLSKDPTELAFSWQDVLKSQIEEAWKAQGARNSIRSLNEFCEKLDKALESGDAKAALNVYYRIRSQASICFNNVDDDLLKLCEKLAQFGSDIKLTMEGAE